MAIELVLKPPTPSTPGAAGERDRVEGVERAEAGQVEDRAEVDEERIVALAGEDACVAVAERVDAVGGERRVVRAWSAGRCWPAATRTFDGDRRAPLRHDVYVCQTSRFGVGQAA